jgi:alcohol dehydrogenase (cytochrome c)
VLLSQVDCVAARLQAAVIAVIAVALGAGAAHAQAPFAGQAYGEAEAARGQAAYAENCAVCHGADLGAGEFGPALKGPSFDAHWQGQGAQALLAFVQNRMPPTGPGSLSSQAYGDIAAYILKINGAKAGPPGDSAAAAPAPAVTPPAPERPRDAIATAVFAARKIKLDALTPVTDAMLTHPSDADWLIWRRTYQVSGFSNLKQIDRTNVAGLRQVWSWSLPQSQNETTPLVHEGVMFVQSGNMVQALDAANGDLLWQYIRPLPAALNGGRNSRAKALAIYRDRLFVPTADKHLIALDIHTGALVWDHEVVAQTEAERRGQPDNGVLQMDGAPIVAAGKVVVGASLGVSAGRGGCFILALDAETGREVWRFNTIARPGQPGGDSWNGAPVDERYGAGVWTSGSYDPGRRLLFFGVGNTYDLGTLLLPHARKGQSNDALYTDATLALDPDTGKLIWFYQHMTRDVWDMDWVFEQTLATLPVDGKPRDVVVTGGKIAVFDVMDRATGKYLFSKDLGVQNLVTAIDPRTGHKTTDPALEPESGKAKLLCPSSSGARSWPTTSFNPATHILYVPIIESCADYTFTARSPAEVAAGGVDLKYPPRVRPDSDGEFGRIEAINLDTRQVVWTLRQRAPIASAMLATAGELVFNGSLDRRFHAYAR